jgi:hypothetical protein
VNPVASGSAYLKVNFKLVRWLAQSAPVVVAGLVLPASIVTASLVAQFWEEQISNPAYLLGLRIVVHSSKLVIL